MKENFSNLVKGIDIEIQEAERVSNEVDTKKPTPRHIILKMPKAKDKERISQCCIYNRKYFTYMGVPIRLSVDFSKETL